MDRGGYEGMKKRKLQVNIITINFNNYYVCLPKIAMQLRIFLSKISTHNVSVKDNLFLKSLFEQK